MCDYHNAAVIFGEWCSTNISWILLILHNLYQTLLFGLFFITLVQFFGQILWRTLNFFPPFFFYFLSFCCIHTGTLVCIQLAGQSYNLSLKGSPYWMAPEVLHIAIGHKFVYSLCLSLPFFSWLWLLLCRSCKLHCKMMPNLILLWPLIYGVWAVQSLKCWMENLLGVIFRGWGHD